MNRPAATHGMAVEINSLSIDVEVFENDLKNVHHIFFTEFSEILGVVAPAAPLAAAPVPAARVVAHWSGNDVTVFFSPPSETWIAENLTRTATQTMKRDDQWSGVGLVVILGHVKRILHLLFSFFEVVGSLENSPLSELGFFVLFVFIRTRVGDLRKRDVRLLHRGNGQFVWVPSEDSWHGTSIRFSIDRSREALAGCHCTRNQPHQGDPSNDRV